MHDGEVIQELASSKWEESDPQSITSWYNEAVIDKSPDTNNGRQMRRVTRLGKYFMNSRSSWNMPSGFIFSVLVDELYVKSLDRDDESLYQTLKAIRDRLSWNKNVYNPVSGSLISEGKEAQLTKLYDELDFHLKNTLNVLEDSSCSQAEALKAWSKFFKDDFFKDKIVRVATVADDEYEIKETQKPWLKS